MLQFNWWRVAVVVLMAFAFGCLWGKFIDGLISFSTLSVNMEIIGGMLIGVSLWVVSSQWCRK